MVVFLCRWYFLLLAIFLLVGTASSALAQSEKQKETPKYLHQKLGSNRFKGEKLFGPGIISPDNRWVAVTSGHGVTLFDFATGKKVEKHIGSGCFSLAFSPDSKILGVLHECEPVLWNIETGKVDRVFSKNKNARWQQRFGAIIRLWFTREGTVMVASGVGLGDFGFTQISVAELKTGKLFFRFKSKSDDPVLFHVSQEGNRLLIYSNAVTGKPNTQQIQIYDWRTGKRVYSRLVKDQPDIYSLDMVEATDTVLIAFSGRTEINRLHGKLLGEVRYIPGGVDIYFSRLTRDGKYLLHENPVVPKLDVYSLTPFKKLRSYSYPGFGFGPSPDGKTLVTIDKATVHLLNLQTGRELPQTQNIGHDSAVTKLRFSPDGKSLYSRAEFGHFEDVASNVAFPADDIAQLQDAIIWDVSTAKVKAELPGTLESLAFSADGKYRICGYYSTRLKTTIVRTRDVKTGKILSEWPFPKVLDNKMFSRFLLTPDGTGTFAVYIPNPFGAPAKKMNKTVLVRFDSKTGNILSRTHIPPGLVLHLVSAPNNRSFLGTLDGMTPERVCTLMLIRSQGRTRYLEQVLPRCDLLRSAMSPNNRLCACAYREYLTLLDWPSGHVIRRHFFAGRRIHAVAISPDSRYLAVSHSKKHRDPYATEPEKHDWLQRFRDWQLFLPTEFDHLISVYDVLSGQEVHRYHELSMPATSLEFSPVGGKLASGMKNGLILIWDTSPITNRKNLLLKHSEADLNRLWQNLGRQTPRAVYPVLHKLTASPGQTLTMLRTKLPEIIPDRKVVAGLIAELDSRSFRQRQLALKKLTDLREFIEPALQQTLSENVPPETRQQLQLLLSKQPDRSPHMHRIRNSMQVLAYIGTPDARKLLEDFSRNYRFSALGQEAKETLDWIR